jgi:CHAT domain-containing protein
MYDFYGSLAARPRDAPGALQSAQRALLASRRAEYRNPYYWAGFVLSTRLP